MKNRISGTHGTALAVAVCALAGATACGASDPSNADVGGQEAALAPGGSNAQVVSHTIPTTLFPGERRFVSVTMRNTGTSGPSNDWTVSPPYGLHSVSTGFNWGYEYVESVVPVGSTHTFDFVLTAPGATSTLKAMVFAVGLGGFGEPLAVPITADPSAVPLWGCTAVSSTLPSQLAPGENRYVTVTVRNTGSATWPATHLRLASRDTPANLWGVTNADLTTAVVSGGTATFGFAVRAPATAGTYSFRRDMKDYAGIGDFRQTGLCFEQDVVVTGQNPRNAAVVSHDLGRSVSVGQEYVATVTMKNTGSETWSADGTYMLYSLNSPVNLWARTLSQVKTVAASGSDATLTLALKAPSVPGTYRHKWQMRRTTGEGAGFFGPVIDVPVTVSSAVTPGNYEVTVNSGACGVGRTGADVSISGGLPVSCPAESTCRFELRPDDWFDVYCDAPGRTYIPRFSTTPAIPPSGGLCGSGWVGTSFLTTECFIYPMTQSYTIDLDWVPDPSVF